LQRGALIPYVIHVKAFDMYDAGGDGAIDTHDFMRLMGSLGIHLTMLEAQDMVNEARCDPRAIDPCTVP